MNVFSIDTPGKIEYKRFDANLNQALAWVTIFQKT